MYKIMDLTGKVYSRLTVVKLHGRINKRTYWECICICGKSKIASIGDLGSGNTRSCGCLQQENRQTVNKTHGMRHTKEYASWWQAKQRCYNPNLDSYSRYGGRGIAMCDRWKNSFENFVSDMGLAPSKEHTIDRKEVNGNYEPSNCRWATRLEQANNKRTSVFVTHNGETKTVKQWSELSKFDYRAFRYRLSRGWNMEQLLS